MTMRRKGERKRRGCEEREKENDEERIGAAGGRDGGQADMQCGGQRHKRERMRGGVRPSSHQASTEGLSNTSYVCMTGQTISLMINACI